MSTASPTTRPTTPRIDALLERIERRMTAQIWLHGLGSVAAVTVVWLFFSYLADRALHVPGPVRWMHLTVLALVPALVAWRTIVLPLRRRPDRAGLAVLVERAHPELAELVVSAVQLSDRPNGAPELVERVVRQAEERAGRLGLEGVFDPRRPRRRAIGGAVAVVLAALWAQANPGLTGIFLARLVGRDVSWPQRTHLTVSVPLSADGAQVRESPDRIDVRTARGTDVPVLVRAEGVEPDEVVLRFEGGRELTLKPSGGGTFRTLLRSCQESLTFSATGGDDRDGLPLVAIEVLDPPDVAGLAVAVTPPAYTGIEPYLVYDRDVEVLAGSALAIDVLPEPPDARGTAQLLPADETVELLARAWPDPEAGDGVRTALGFDVVATAALRFRVHLTDESGLSNPDPGLFAVHVLEDRRPDVQLVSPGRGELETTAGGLLRLVARAEDDFGLSQMTWSASEPGTEEPIAGSSMDFAELAPGEPGEGRPVRAWVAAARVEVSSLSESGAAVAGTLYEVQVSARDNRPEGGVGRSAVLRLRVVSEEELLRRVQDRLVRARALVGELEELNRAKAQRTNELLASLESDDLAGSLSEGELLAALTGARRVQGDARSIARELASVAETVLYARLDEKAVGLLGHLDQGLGRMTDKRFQADLWLDLAAAWREGRLGAPGFAGQLVGLTDLGLSISEVDAAGAARALDEAAAATDVSELHDRLTIASEHQARAQAHIDDLLERLAEWDNFQSILTLTRDILNRQKALEDRTRSAAREK